VFVRQQGPERVLVGVNRGPARTLRLGPLGVPPGTYPGVLADTGDANRSSQLVVAADGQVAVHLEQFGALVVKLPDGNH
jgi:hypothetical protein